MPGLTDSRQTSKKKLRNHTYLSYSNLQNVPCPAAPAPCGGDAFIFGVLEKSDKFGMRCLPRLLAPEQLQNQLSMPTACNLYWRKARLHPSPAAAAAATCYVLRLLARRQHEVVYLNIPKDIPWVWHTGHILCQNVFALLIGIQHWWLDI